MVKKNITIYFFVLFFVVACSTSRKGSQSTDSENVSRKKLPILVQSRSENSQNRSEEVKEEESDDDEEPVAKPVNVGVWIQGVGYDAFASLGFLQELERVGLKPKKVMGGGFGCWIAWSWALENNGNRAEWQSFKWDQWNYLKNASLLGRLGLQNNKERFLSDVNKHFPRDLVSRTKIPVDCPLVKNRFPYDLSSGRSISLGNMMWEQFQIPSITKAQAAQNAGYLSGLFAGLPLGAELDRFSSGDVEAWIILRSHESNEMLESESREALVLSQRTRLSQPSRGQSPRGRPWLVIDVIDGAGRPVSSLMDSQKRRRLILDGRSYAKKLLQEQGFRSFIYQASPMD